MRCHEHTPSLVAIGDIGPVAGLLAGPSKQFPVHAGAAGRNAAGDQRDSAKLEAALLIR